MGAVAAVIGHVGHEAVQAGGLNAGVVEEIGLVPAYSVAAGANGGVDAL